MLFEVTKNGHVFMSTTSEKCIPPPETLRQMMSAGYKLKKDGKVYKVPKEQKRGGAVCRKSSG